MAVNVDYAVGCRTKGACTFFLSLLSLLAMAALPHVWAHHFADPVSGTLGIAAGLAAVGLPFTLARSSGWRPWAGAILAIGLLARIAAFHWMIRGGLGADPLAYSTIAKHVLSGNGLYYDDAVYGPNLYALYPPLYPIVLAGARAICGSSNVTTLIVNVTCDMAAGLLVFALGVRFGRLPARVAAALFWLAPPIVLSAAALSKEPLAMALILGAIFLGERLVDGSARWRGWVAFGLVVGLTALCQPAFVTFPAFYIVTRAASMRMPWRILTRPILVALSAFVLVMSPWWIRNAATFGHFVPLTTGAEIALAVATRAEGRDAPSLEMMKQDEIARAHELGLLARHRILADPKTYLVNVAKRSARAAALNDNPGQFFDSFQPPPLRPVAAFAALSLQTGYACLLVLTVVGLIGVWRGPFWSLASPWLVASASQLMLFTIWVEFGDRHRAFILPFLMLAAAQTRSRMTDERAREKQFDVISN